jgi:predicted restriction endonuclease
VRRDWTREELIVAFNLYCRTPFGRIHNRNPEIIATATAIGRTPSALSWKLANFSRFDPSVRGRSLTGATHGSSLDREIWEEFHSNWNALALESEKLRAKFLHLDLEKMAAKDFPDGHVRRASVDVRVTQGFFRSMILAAYNARCCITGLPIPELLCASHIVPWSTDDKNRANPRNGLCLNALHDRAFDRGLISIDAEFRVITSAKAKTFGGEAVKEFLVQFAGRKIELPEQFKPDSRLLAYHRETIFQGK